MQAGRNVGITTAIEHKAVLEAVHEIVREGGEERIVPVTNDGLVDRGAYSAALDSRVAIASVMWVNNETGVIQDIPRLAAMAKGAGAVFHTDAVQAFGKVDVDAATMPFDLLTISGHKIGAPKGIGAVFIRRGTALEPIIDLMDDTGGLRDPNTSLIAPDSVMSLASVPVPCAQM